MALAPSSSTDPAVGGEAADLAGIAAAWEPRPLGLWPMCGLALIMGIVTGLGAVLFRP